MGGGGDGDGDGAHTFWSPVDFNSYPSSSSRSYLGSVEPNKAISEKAHNVNDAAMISEIDCVMRTHTDSLLRAIDGLSMRLSQLESKTHQLELSVDDLKVSVGNKHQSTDGEFRHIENIILEVQSSVQDLKVKQEASMNPSEQTTPTPQQSNTQHSSVASLQLFPSISPRAPPRQSANPFIQLPTQYPPAHTSAAPQLDTFFPSASQTQEVLSQQFQPPPAQQQQPQTLPPPRGVEHQQYQLTPPSPYPQAPQQHQQPIATVNPLLPQPQPPTAYPPSFHQPSSPPTSGSLPFQQFLGSAPPSHMYESLSSSIYSPPTGPTEPYPYSGSSSHYGNDLAGKYQPHSSGTGGNNYPQIPTAMILPRAIPTPSTVNAGAGSGNRVPIDDVVDKVASMGFPREYVRATVRKLTDNGQAVDLNVVLDKLMNDGGVQPPRG